MNRELKFRVWDKKNHKIYYPDLIAISRIGAVRVDYDISFLPGDCEIQQYTGLKDKNGKEIYEGDVVNVKRCFVRPYIKDEKIDYRLLEGDLEIGIVFWGSEAKILVEYKAYDDIEDIKSIPHRYEVIGNIFENPDLLA